MAYKIKKQKNIVSVKIGNRTTYHENINGLKLKRTLLREKGSKYSEKQMKKLGFEKKGKMQKVNEIAEYK